MKYIVSGKSIILYGVNRKMELQLFLLFLPVAVLGFIIFLAILLGSGMFIARAASVLGLIAFTGLLIAFMISIRKAHNSHTIIDRSNNSIKVISFGNTEDHSMGDFKNILIEEVGIGRGVIHKAFMTCSEGNIDLGLVANTKSGLRRKIKPLTDYLGLPIEEKLDDNVIHIFGK